MPLVAFGAVTAALSAQQLGDLPIRGGIRPDPVASTAGAIALLLTLAVYAALARWIVRRGGGERDAVGAGSLAGTLAGALGGLLSAAATSDYLREVLRSYAVPQEELLAVALSSYVIIWTIASAVSGALVTWLSYTLWRRRAAG